MSGFACIFSLNAWCPVFVSGRVAAGRGRLLTEYTVCQHSDRGVLEILKALSTYAIQGWTAILSAQEKIVSDRSGGCLPLRASDRLPNGLREYGKTRVCHFLCDSRS